MTGIDFERNVTDTSIIAKILRDSDYQLAQFSPEDQHYFAEQIFVKDNKHGTQDYYVKYNTYNS